MTPLTDRGKQLRRDSLKLGIPNGIYHWGGSFSVIEILIALYDNALQPEDKVIMSKGHSWIPQVVILRERGLSPGFGPRLDKSDELCLVGHPFLDEANGIYANTGSLGHGMPLGLGMAFARKLKQEDGRIYVIAGDGEIQEGTFWESLLLGKRFKLDNLTVIVDCNGIQGSGRIDGILPMHRTNLNQIAMFSGWASTVVDGHHVQNLVSALEWCQTLSTPQLIIANTVKGRGVSYMESRPEWHARYPNDAELVQAYEELA